MMKYKVTSRYLKSKERLIALFAANNDARMFIGEKISNDEQMKQGLVYRLYDELELIQEFNDKRVLSREIEDPETFNDADCVFSVVTQPDHSFDRSTIALFSNNEDANLFISSKLTKDSSSITNDTFMIFKAKILIATLNKNIIEHKALKNINSSGNSTGAILSPLSTRPTPPGGPKDYWVEKNDENE